MIFQNIFFISLHKVGILVSQKTHGLVPANDERASSLFAHWLRVPDLFLTALLSGHRLLHHQDDLGPL